MSGKSRHTSDAAAAMSAMSDKPRRIGVSLGNIGALHDGLGEFSLQIGQRIAAQAGAWREAHGIGFVIHNS